MSAVWPVLRVAIQWFSAAYMTKEITDVVTPKIDHALDDSQNVPAQTGAQHVVRKPFLERLIPTTLQVVVSAVLFFTIKYAIEKILKK